MKLDLTKVPFSRFGSYFVFSLYDGNLHLRSVHGACHGNFNGLSIFIVKLIAGGRSVPFEYVADPVGIRLTSTFGHAELVIARTKEIRIRSSGVGVRLEYVGDVQSLSLLERASGAWEVNSHTHRNQFMIRPLYGSVKASPLMTHGQSRNASLADTHIDLNPEPEENQGEWAIEEFRSVYRPSGPDVDFDEACLTVGAEYNSWIRQSLASPEEYTSAHELASYVNWSAVVAPEGHFRRPAMLMSKNYMANVWSWDHCFNAMATANQDPALAWDQFMIIFDHQDESGALPDNLNDRNILWNFSKPPIHGLTLMWLMNNSKVVTMDRLEEVYEPLARWTNCWFKYRDDDGDGIPQYNHGYDSGWDNSTMFLAGVPVEGPDLASFLILQLEALSEVARRLDKPEESAHWSQRAKDLLDLMISHCWRETRFVAPESGGHKVMESDSLVAFVPIILGRRLPQPILNQLISGLQEKGAFLTQCGLATERLDSPYYVSDGYWRGPIWAPSTFLIILGLQHAGESLLADRLATSFCELCVKSGFAENFDAITGAGLRDPAYTWTSSVFLLLARSLVLDKIDVL